MSVPISPDDTVADLDTAARRVASLIWDDDPEVRALEDPRLPGFAAGLIDGLAEALGRAPGVLQRVLSGAAAAAEDLNVEAFQGLIEILQNADDLSASEVRFAIRNDDGRSQLLIVHDGHPVTFHHILPMTLPYLTTKADNALQKGRFGVGLKTLRRISTRMAVHCSPYHFRAEALEIERTEAETKIESFYDSAKDTMVVLDLMSDFDREDLKRWFDHWDDDGLLFLNTVRRFRWCELNGVTVAEKAVSAADWQPFNSQVVNELRIQQRTVLIHNRVWTVFRAEASVSSGLQRAHKAKGDITTISIAVSDRQPANGVFIGFPTRVPANLPFAIDAQFDPSTARDALIQNPWNSWLIERCADVLVAVATGLLATDPRAGWRMIPLDQEHIGTETEHWPGSAFSVAFDRVRRDTADTASLPIDGVGVPLKEVAYEHESVAGLLGSAEIERLFPAKRAVPGEARDDKNRWRGVLGEMGVSQIVGTTELLAGFSGFVFQDKGAEWWVEAADRLTRHHSNVGQILGVPCWLSAESLAIPCQAIGSTCRLLVFGGSSSRFCQRWRMLDRLHDSYGEKVGEHALSWLRQNAAFSEGPDAEIELAAFAEAFAGTPVRIGDEELRELRDHFDAVPDLRAEDLGRRVGAALLLDGFSYKARKKAAHKVSPLNAYLPRTLDSDHPHWPEAADGVAGIAWLSASYDDKLRIVSMRASRKRADGVLPRGARRFLMLLGAECAPRIVELERHTGSGEIRRKELREAGAEFVKLDYGAPDLERVLSTLPRLSKRQRKLRSAALLRTLSRHWSRLYATNTAVTAMHEARVYLYIRGNVTAIWLCRLREAGWVAVGDGRMVEPHLAVIKSTQTEALYESTDFVCGIEEGGVSPEMAAALRLITQVRVNDLVAHLRRIRENEKPFDPAGVLAIYRTLARFCPDVAAPNSHVGNLTVEDLRERFSEGRGLICIGAGEWRKPTQLFGGRDVFHRPEMFVPAGATYHSLWLTLDVRKPHLGDCVRYCKELARQSYSGSVDAVLIDVYRYMDALGPLTDRRRLRDLPLVCGGRWTSERPIYFVEDREHRDALGNAVPGSRFWTPPCDMRDLPNLTKGLALAVLNPTLTVAGDLEQALDRGQGLRDRFQRGVDHLSNELARNDPSTREKLTITWDELRNVSLFVYDEPFTVIVLEPQLTAAPVEIALRALLSASPPALHLLRVSVGLRDYGGRIIGSLFSRDVQRTIEAEWSASWLASEEEPIEPMRFASDQEHEDALAERARKTETAPPGKIKVTAPSSRTPSAKPRLLKTFQGGIKGVTVLSGMPPKPPAGKARTGLLAAPPQPAQGSRQAPATPPGYTNTDIEQRGWEVLAHVLNTAEASELADFRKRHGVGADGVIDWKTFVEMKATGRGSQSSIEMSNSEYERAKERGLDFILALVSGLEEGQSTEVRLILDPVRRATVQPIQGMRLVNLADAPAVLVQLDNDQMDPD